MKKAFFTITLVFAGSAALAAIDPRLDKAATAFEESTEHFLQTIHHEAPQLGAVVRHLDADMHELSEAAQVFHEEVHHDHGHEANVAEYKKIQDLYPHTASTFYADYWSWTAHMRADWKLVRTGFYDIDTALFWSGGGPGHGHGHDGHRH